MSQVSYNIVITFDKFTPAHEHIMVKSIPCMNCHTTGKIINQDIADKSKDAYIQCPLCQGRGFRTAEVSINWI